MAMNPVLYSWLAVAAVSPFVAILSCWTLAVFRSYRSEWRVLDIFLVALTTLEGVSAMFSFGYSILGVIRPALEAPCRFLVWGITTTRTFHLSAVTSLLLDRALSAKWSKAYKKGVKHSQVRYHVVVLCIISIFVGVTSVFARRPLPPNNCSLHPLEWDLKFSAFLTCVYGLLLIIGLGGCLLVQLTRYRISLSKDSNISREYCNKSPDLEWSVTVSVCLLSYVINHGPYLVLNWVGMAAPSAWSQWTDNTIIWLQIAQGILVPCVLLLADMPHKSALSNMLRQPGRIYRHLSDYGGFRMQMGDTTNSKQAIPIYRGQPFPQRLRWSPTQLPSLQSLQPLDINSLNKSYGSRGYTTLLSLPSSTTSFSSPYSSCSSVSRSVNSVTTNAVDDFVFRRPSVLALFEPNTKEEEKEESCKGRRCDTPTPFIDPDFCNCDTTKDVIGKNMINIILAYEDNQSSTQEDQCQDESLEDLSSLTSSESSDADSVQSVIIRQRVDQRGRVSESDITIAQRKVIRCHEDTVDTSSDEQKVIYSEYL